MGIRNFAFGPADVSVKVGDVVKWVNSDDAPHTVTFDDESIDGSSTLDTGGEFEFSFGAAGTYAYHCRIHPSMKGSVTAS